MGRAKRRRPNVPRFGNLDSIRQHVLRVSRFRIGASLHTVKAGAAVELAAAAGLDPDGAAKDERDESLQLDR